MTTRRDSFVTARPTSVDGGKAGGDEAVACNIVETNPQVVSIAGDVEDRAEEVAARCEEVR